MTTGVVVRFDGERGYGFIEPDDGGEDVFIHASALEEAVKSHLRIGKRVHFKTLEGERGLKAFDVQIINGDLPEELTGKAQPTAAGTTPAPDTGAEPRDETCDVLTKVELRHEITELMLKVAPDLTGAQIVAVRDGVAKLAEEHGWIDG